jgi:hypothetical protein
MRKIFFIIILTFVVAGAYAQTSRKDSNFVAKKNELIIEIPANLTQLNIPSGIMYRRNFKKISMRVRLTGSYRDSYSTNTLQTSRQFSYTPAVGFQRNVRVASICQFYWGADLAYSKSVTSLKDSVINNRNFTNTIGLLPFVGIKFTFGKRLIMGAENAGAYNYKHLVTIDDRNDGTYNTHIESNSNSFSFSYSKNVRFYLGLNF